MYDDYYNADDDDVIDEGHSENEMVIDNDFNDVQLSLQSNLVESDVAAPKARTISSKVIHINNCQL